MKRLESLDVLRGFDMFMLTAFGAVCTTFIKAGSFSWSEAALFQFGHVSWEGFAAWDLIMPLFMFCSGVAIPFAMTKYREQRQSKSRIYWRIVKRVLVLWIFGMICQGRLLELNPQTLVYYSNTLQTIAVGYAVSAIFFLHTKPCTQVVSAMALLLGYWLLMMFVRVDGYGGGSFTPEGNLCEWVDRAVLGSHCDHVTIDEATGVVGFRERYNYTWVLSSMNFIVTVMTGMFAGEIMKSAWTNKRKLLTMLALGVGMTVLGWLWNLQMPVIKHIWTSSMTLVASGYCFLLMTLFYWLVDVRQIKGWGVLKVFGMNAIFAYMLVQLFKMRIFTTRLLFGFEQYLGTPWYEFLIAVANAALLWAILRALYKHKVFLRV